MTSAGITMGFQWLNGSFTENVEISEGRDPRDLDIVTFYIGQHNVQGPVIATMLPEFSNPILSKASYLLDHYPVDYGFRPDVTVELTRYWIQLFTHNRNGIWKGILRIELNTPNEDQQARDLLNLPNQ